jgi:hypothetical protein
MPEDEKKVKFNPITWRNVTKMKELGLESSLPDESLEKANMKKKALKKIISDEPSMLQKLLNKAKEHISNIFSGEEEAPKPKKVKPYEELTPKEKKALFEKITEVPQVPKAEGDF